MSLKQFSSSLGVKAVMVASQVKVTGSKLSLICFYYYWFCQVQVQAPLPTDPYAELRSPYFQKRKTLKHMANTIIVIIIIIVVVIIIIIIVCRS